MVWLALSCAACSAYRVGSHTLYRPDIETIHVPIFDSVSFRRGLGEQLTEAVVKAIQLRTPYRVECAADADSILSGRLVSEGKRVLAEDINDVPRSIGTNMMVEIRWESRNGDLLRDSTTLPLPPTLLINQTASLVPEGGQSIATAHQRAISQLAEQIVSQLEYPW